MQFKVPQFLEIEDKIFGPFTFKEFIYLAGGAGVCYMLFKLLGFLIGLIPMLLVAGFAGALTFYHPNNKPFLNMVQSGFKYVAQNKLYIWKKQKKEIGVGQKKETLGKEETYTATTVAAPRLGASKLRDLAWSLDVLDLKKGRN